MRDPVTLPLLLFLLIVALAAVTFLSRLLLPGMRWWLRGRLNHVVAVLNTRLRLKIRPFKLTRREVLVDRLIYDPQVLEAAAERARGEGAPQEAAMREVTRYAREIVPAFNAYLCFRLGCWIARTVSRSIFRAFDPADERDLVFIPVGINYDLVLEDRTMLAAADPEAPRRGGGPAHAHPAAHRGGVRRPLQACGGRAQTIDVLRE